MQYVQPNHEAPLNWGRIFQKNSGKLITAEEKAEISRLTPQLESLVRRSAALAPVEINKRIEVVRGALHLDPSDGEALAEYDSLLGDLGPVGEARKIGYERARDELISTQITPIALRILDRIRAFIADLYAEFEKAFGVLVGEFTDDLGSMHSPLSPRIERTLAHITDQIDKLKGERANGAHAVLIELGAMEEICGCSGFLL